MNRREYDRYIAEFPARFVGDCEGSGIVYNLGMGGCKIVTDRPLTTDLMVALSLDIPGQSTAIRVRMAVVRWMLHYEFGIEFLGMEESERERLAQYLQRLAAAAAA
ncbi:MAG TPA: PilZ domain-containing protein [Nitrospira sp.]|jgi:PilZ domain|nr:PilZ domain-containing protein [Nitrospira sp.]